MRIAQIAPLFESVPPRLYGGTERVVSYLTEELIRQGHQVSFSRPGTPSPRPSSFRALPVRCASIRMSVTQFRITR